MITEQIQRIKDNQKFLLKLLHLHIGNYYPLRQWLGIDYTGKIDEISHLSYGYDTQYFKKGTQWYKKQTRVYQQPDLGYKLNWILDSIPEVIIPKSEQPSWGLIQMRLARCAEAIYQPTVRDTYIWWSYNGNYPSDGTTNYLYLGYTTASFWGKGLFDFDLSDIDDLTVIDATFSLYSYQRPYYSGDPNYNLYRLLQLNWGETTATWVTYDGTNSWNTSGCEGNGSDYTSVNNVYRIGCNVGWNHWTNAQNLIQDCWDNQSKHVQLVLRPSPTVTYQWNYFYSRRETTNLTLRPKLTIIITGTASAKNSLSVFTSLRSVGETGLPTSLALSTTLQSNRWAKDTIHTQEWVKEPTHDKMYKS